MLICHFHLNVYESILFSAYIEAVHIRLTFPSKHFESQTFFVELFLSNNLTLKTAFSKRSLQGQQDSSVHRL